MLNPNFLLACFYYTFLFFVLWPGTECSKISINNQSSASTGLGLGYL